MDVPDLAGRVHVGAHIDRYGLVADLAGELRPGLAVHRERDARLALDEDLSGDRGLDHLLGGLLDLGLLFGLDDLDLFLLALEELGRPFLDSLELVDGKRIQNAHVESHVWPPMKKCREVLSLPCYRKNYKIIFLHCQEHFPILYKYFFLPNNTILYSYKIVK